jgi:hypothetical protein
MTRDEGYPKPRRLTSVNRNPQRWTRALPVLWLAWLGVSGGKKGQSDGEDLDVTLFNEVETAGAAEGGSPA